MTRFWLWTVLTSGGVVAGFFGLCSWETTVSGAYFTGLALAIHCLFGEDA